MFEVSLEELSMWIAGFQQVSKQDQLLVIAIVNAIVWVGAFLFMLWQLNRRTKSIEDWITLLEASITDDDKT